MAEHGDTDEGIAILLRETPHALTFGTKDDGEGTCQFTVVEFAIRLVRRADDTNPGLITHPFQKPRHVPHGNHRDIGGPSTGHSHRRLGHGRGFVPRDNHRKNSRSFGRSQAGSQIVGILDSIENQKERFLHLTKPVKEIILGETGNSG